MSCEETKFSHFVANFRGKNWNKHNHNILFYFFIPCDYSCNSPTSILIRRREKFPYQEIITILKPNARKKRSRGSNEDLNPFSIGVYFFFGWNTYCRSKRHRSLYVHNFRFSFKVNLIIFLNGLFKFTIQGLVGRECFRQ